MLIIGRPASGTGDQSIRECTAPLRPYGGRQADARSPPSSFRGRVRARSPSASTLGRSGSPSRPHDPGGTVKGRAQGFAGVLAPAALFGGQTAVLMVMRVTLALGRAGANRGQACLKRR